MTLTSYVSQTGVLTAETLWILQAIMSGYSVNSCDGLGELFKAMFPDSEIAQKMKLGRTRIGYIINYGLGPYFKKLMIESVEVSPIYCFSFDESMSDATQRSEMVVMVRYWDDELYNAKVQYLGSSFFGHARNDDLLREFNKITSSLDQKKLFQISMDGPNVNLLFYKKIVMERNEKSFHSLLDTGVCGLHSVNCCVKNGFKLEFFKNMSKTLKGVFILLHGSAARQDGYCSMTGSQSMPLFFCATRWVENKRVADRLIEIWPHVLKIVKFWLGLAKSKQPKGSSWENVSGAINDLFIVTKLKFFSYICSLVEPFLVKYQTQEPMIPYMYYDLKRLFKSLLKLIVKPDALEKCKNAKDLINLDLEDESILLTVKNVSVGFGVEELLKEMENKDITSVKSRNNFRLECRKAVTVIINQLSERSPLNCDFIRYTFFFISNSIFNLSLELLAKFWKMRLKVA